MQLAHFELLMTEERSAEFFNATPEGKKKLEKNM
jgi:hypothetical protein